MDNQTTEQHKPQINNIYIYTHNKLTPQKNQISIISNNEIFG